MSDHDKDLNPMNEDDARKWLEEQGIIFEDELEPYVHTEADDIAELPEIRDAIMRIADSSLIGSEENEAPYIHTALDDLKISSTDNPHVRLVCGEIYYTNRNEPPPLILETWVDDFIVRITAIAHAPYDFQKLDDEGEEGDLMC